MGFFNKIGDIANKTYEKTTQKTSEIAKEAKIKIKMNESKSKINEIYQEIGKLVYQNHTDKVIENFDEKINENCSKIDEISKEIKENQNELLKLKNKRICENCYEEIDISVKYCPHCAFEQPKNEEEDKSNNEEDNNDKNDEEINNEEKNTDNNTENE